MDNRMAITPRSEPARAATPPYAGRKRLCFNQGWKFVLQNIPEAISPDYDIKQLMRWENVNLPHSIRLEPVHGSQANPTCQAECMYVKHFPLAPELRGRKLYMTFEGVMGVSDVWVNGVHMHTALADHAPAAQGANTNYGGYLPFVIDITDAAYCDGRDNVITVMADNRDNGDVPPGKPQANLDFTYFGGIYRNVWLDVTERVHITDALFENIEAGGGIVVEYPEVSRERATVSLNTHVRNESGRECAVELRSEIIDREGRRVGQACSGQSIAPGCDFTFGQSVVLTAPRLWNIDDPYLHTLVSTLTVDGVEADRVKTAIGIRKIEIDRARGLFINGELAPLLQGGNRHQDYPVIGNAAPDSLQYRDAVKFREAGFNVVRAAHYPMSPEFVRCCNELGILLFEAVPGWQYYAGTEVFDLRVRDALRQLVRRDRNAPCLLAYETVLNETYNVPADYTEISNRVVLAESPSALLATESQGYSVEASGRDELASFMFGHPESDAMGKSTRALGFVREYGDCWLEDHGTFQGRRISRGTNAQTGAFYPGGEGRMLQQANNRLWDRDFKRALAGGYAEQQESLLNKYLNRRANPAYVGATMWTAQDNRGFYSKMSLTGIWGHYRLPKFAYYAFESQRPAQTDPYLAGKGVKSGPSLFIASYWGEHAPVLDLAKYGEPPIGSDAEREIYVYSNAASVRLSVEKDGNVLWSRTHAPLSNAEYEDIELLPHPPFEFLNVPYTRGSSLTAVGYDAQGAEIARQRVCTAGAPAQLRLEADYAGVDFTADGSDLMRIYAYVLDSCGNVCPEAGNLIRFTACGNASIVGDGIKRAGANPVNAEAGIATIYLRAGDVPGQVIVRAHSEGLEDGMLKVDMRPMTVPAAPYTLIPREGADMSTGSMFMDARESRCVGEGVEAVHVSIGGAEYDHSLRVTHAYVEYELGGNYQRLTAQAAAVDGEDTVFKVYADGVLRYAGASVAGEKLLPGEIDVDVSGANTVRLIAQRPDGQSASCLWLSPYVYEGKTPADDSELYAVNLALGRPVSATAGTGAANVTDGDSETLWQGDVFRAGTEQSVTVDLGHVERIRNARIELGVDNTTYGYEVLTSADGENWARQSAAERTGWTNAAGYIDRFTAEARFVRVAFTGVSEGLPAALREVHVYPDMGVDTVSEYRLRGLAVDGFDIVFDDSRRSYEIRTGDARCGSGCAGDCGQRTFIVRTWAQDEWAVIDVNGVRAENPSGMTDLGQAAPVRAVPDDSGDITVTVTPRSGYGANVYTIHVCGVSM